MSALPSTIGSAFSSSTIESMAINEEGGMGKTMHEPRRILSVINGVHFRILKILLFAVYVFARRCLFFGRERCRSKNNLFLSALVVEGRTERVYAQRSE